MESGNYTILQERALERRALGAYKALAKDILLVAANVEDLLAAQRDVEAAGGLAQRAGVEGVAFGRGVHFHSLNVFLQPRALDRVLVPAK